MTNTCGICGAASNGTCDTCANDPRVIAQENGQDVELCRSCMRPLNDDDTWTDGAFLYCGADAPDDADRVIEDAPSGADSFAEYMRQGDKG